MIRFFNAFQLVTLFALLPFLIGWLHGDPFPYSVGVECLAVIAYAAIYVFHCVAVYEIAEGK